MALYFCPSIFYPTTTAEPLLIYVRGGFGQRHISPVDVYHRNVKNLLIVKIFFYLLTKHLVCAMIKSNFEPVQK